MAVSSVLLLTQPLDHFSIEDMCFYPSSNKECSFRIREMRMIGEDNVFVVRRIFGSNIILYIVENNLDKTIMLSCAALREAAENLAHHVLHLSSVMSLLLW